jgi:hypothetical protein
MALDGPSGSGKSGVSARWRAFDFEVGARADGTYPMRAEFTERHPAAVIVLDGAYATREAASFLEAWHGRWDAARPTTLRMSGRRRRSI